MAITKKVNRQYPLVARVTFVYTDLPEDVTTTTVIPAIDLPAGAIVTGGYLYISTAWATSSAATIAVGDGDTANRYLGDTDIKSTGRTALVPTGYKYTAADTVDLDLAIATSASTAGAGELVVEYIIEDRANEVQPL